MVGLNRNKQDMKKAYFILTAIVTAFTAVIFYSFQTTLPVLQKNGIKLYELSGSPEFPDAELSLLSPSNGAILPEGKDSFTFDVKNYQLGAQTPDAGQAMCANSAKGQHIHFIMDNAPYFASYNTEIVSDLKPGHHVLLAFLSRSYHESLKQKNAFVLKEFNVGSDTKDNFDENAPHIFFSRPKGEYIGTKETQKLMLDFYLVNCALSPDGYKVRATINGTDFILTKWVPYIVEGLALGEVKVKLELLDNTGKPVASPFNGVERTCTLKTEPFKN